MPYRTARTRITATTDYVWRGVTQSDGDPALQLGLDLNTGSGFFAGAWASTVDISNYAGSQRDLEVDYYAGYAEQLGNRFTVTGNVVAYTYPGAEGSVDYDYLEYGVALNYDDFAWLAYAYTPDLYDSGYETHHVELHAEFPLAGAWLIGGGAGYYDVSRLSGSGYGHWELGVKRSFDRFEVDLRYHDANRPVRFVSSPDRVDARYALSVTWAFP